jgi:hypothetical protein
METARQVQGTASDLSGVNNCMRSVGCPATLLALCGSEPAGKPCDVCVGTHQRALRAAHCSNSDVLKYCARS